MFISNLNARYTIVFLLVILMAVASAHPAMAWFEEGELSDGQVSLPCRMIIDSQEGYTVHCFDRMPHNTHIAVQASKPLAHPAVLRAESPFQSAPEADDYLAQTGQ